MHVAFFWQKLWLLWFVVISPLATLQALPSLHRSWCAHTKQKNHETWLHLEWSTVDTQPFVLHSGGTTSLTGPWRDFSVHTGDIQKLPGHSPGQLALRSPAWAREAVGQDNLQGLEDMEKGKVLNGVFASICPGKLCSQASLAPEPRTELGEQGYCEKPWQVE